jgi:uncharacterized SAM-binding protein YcdF (DUF218 family)
MDSNNLLFLKPLLTTIVTPPVSPLLMIFAGVWVSLQGSKLSRVLSRSLVLVGASLLWILSCEDTAVWLSRHILPQYSPVSLTELKQAQVIVVLGGGTKPYAAEYGSSELTPQALERLRYAVFLSKQSHLPIAFTGGQAWGVSEHEVSEAQVAQRTLKRDWDMELTFSETLAKDTRQNAQLSFALLAKSGVKKIVIVTHAWHMPRAYRNFSEAGFDVTPAPMGYITHTQSSLLDALPSEGGLRDSKWVIHEWLGLLLT